MFIPPAVNLRALSKQQVVGDGVIISARHRWRIDDAAALQGLQKA